MARTNKITLWSILHPVFALTIGLVLGFGNLYLTTAQAEQKDSAQATVEEIEEPST